MLSTDNPDPDAPTANEETVGNTADTEADAVKRTGWLTAQQAAAFLRVGIQTIKNYERRGLLHPITDAEVALYNPTEVYELLQGKDRKRLKSQFGEDGLDTTTWMTRHEAADFLHCALQTLKNYERRGMLHSLRVRRRDGRGHEQVVAVYEPSEVHKLPRGRGRGSTPREATETESRSFELFNEGKTVRDVVIALRETSDRVREFHKKWLTDGVAHEQIQQHEKEREAHCFELFSQGNTVREVVIEMRETSDRVRALHERWFDDGGADLVITETAKKAFEKLFGPFKDVTELLMLTTNALKRLNT